MMLKTFSGRIGMALALGLVLGLMAGIASDSFAQTISISTNKGCLNKGDAAFFRMGEPFTLFITLGWPVPNYVSVGLELPNGQTETLLSQVLMGGQTYTLNGYLRYLLGPRKLFASARGYPNGDLIAGDECTYAVIP